VLSAREVTLYLYLSMLLGSDPPAWYPTTQEICEDLGISSRSVVFDALRVLIEDGFIVRERRSVSGRRGRQNVYARPSCEFTIYRLLQANRIDGMLRARPGVENRMSPEARDLKLVWLRAALGDELGRYLNAELPQKRAILISALEKKLAPRS
jgi:hypothetical protein